MIPYSESYDTFVKTNKIILRQRTYQGSKTPYERVLQKYLLVAFNKQSLNILPKLVKSHISYTRYSRIIQDLGQTVSFFLISISLPFTNIKDIDKTAKLLDQISEETISFSQNLRLFLFDLDWKFVEKVLFKHYLALTDFPVSPETLEEQKYGHIFSTITNDISIFARNGKMNFINRPDITTPDLFNNIEIGLSIKDQRPVGLSSQQLVLYGNHSTKIYHVIMNYLLGLSSTFSDSLTIIFNFNDFAFTMPLDLPYIVKRFTPNDFNLDPILIIHEHPETRINLIKALIHIFELLPSEVGAFQGILSDYLNIKDKNNSIPASIADFYTYVKTKALQDPTTETLDNTVIETTEKQGFDISDEQVSLDTLENQGPIINRSYQSIENKIKFLLYLTKRKKSSPIPLLLRKKGTIYFQATKTNQQEALLTFFLVTEIAQTIDPNFTLIALGFDTILSTIHNFSQQSFYRQYIHVVQRDNYLIHFKEFNMRYLAFIQLLGSEINTIWTDTINNGNIPENYRSILCDNTDLAILRRSDNQSRLIPFSISEKLRNAEQDTERITVERIQRDTISKFSHLQPLSTEENYRILWFMAEQPDYLNYPENIALNLSEYYFDGLDAIEELKEKKYISRQSRLARTLILTPEAQILIDAMPNYIKQFQSVSISELSEMNKVSYQLETMLPGLIKNDLPNLNWTLIHLFFHYTNNSLTNDEIINRLFRFTQKKDKKNKKDIETPIEEHNRTDTLSDQPVQVTPPDIKKSSGIITVAPGFRLREQAVDTSSSADIITQPDQPKDGNSQPNTLVQATSEIRYTKTNVIPNISKNLVSFPTFTNNLSNNLPQVDELNKLSIGENKKEFTSAILLGRNIQNNKASVVFSLIDESYTNE
jgi:hypothetical protein